jgi:uncharacterized damage-inducible protein DinB
VERREAGDAGEVLKIDVAIEVRGQVGVHAFDARRVVARHPRYLTAVRLTRVAIPQAKSNGLGHDPVMHTRELLADPTAYLSPRLALDGLAPELADRSLPGAPHTIGEIVAHMAFWQAWFTGRCDGTAGPMPASAALGWVAPEPGRWDAVRAGFLDGLDHLAALGAATDRERRIDPPIEFPPLGHYTVGDVLVHVATHNAHHLGQVVLLRQLHGAWPPPSGSWTW